MTRRSLGTRLVKAVQNRRDTFMARSDVIARLPLFAPNSAPGSLRQLTDLTLQACDQTFPFLVEVVRGCGITPIAIEDAEAFCADPAHRAIADAMKPLFDGHGSDKANVHQYHLAYGRILAEIGAVQAMLEIGMGTNNVDVASNMGSEGRPGASLRAFRDYLKDAQIFGADIDRDILFTEERIRSFFVDQTDLSSFERLDANLPDSLDLIIDDGLHSPNANLAVLGYAVRKLRPGQWFVIEDIPERATAFWQGIDPILARLFETHLIRVSSGLLYAGKRRPAA
ncbi:hypothetical protein GO308_02605 [Sphingomonas sp. SFZ2018-12]|uniref:class I SAM-dependent methyltransferase n=1 Tax=Sphingomonas sp. SFZ2018-12 TaxID=2683197 RepID=UPI001F1073CD|nr:class I SAM-dependent methyltransferase [Sphingomonas sp. SFZ2018-12]MCH4892002.1 hypothetical protein [Sphingomonas sp. SFZ2018-12]